METRVEAMNEVQFDLFRSAAVRPPRFSQPARYENSSNLAKKPDP
jgi:hypothetical protein